jgi:hypothetical protein
MIGTPFNTTQLLFQEYVDQALDAAIDGTGGIPGARALVADIRRDRRYRSNEERAKALIRSQAHWSGGTGFLIGLFGLRGAVPRGALSWFRQTRLAASIAILYGHDVRLDHIRAEIFVCMLLGIGLEAAKQLGIQEVMKLVAVQAAATFGPPLLVRGAAATVARVGFTVIPRAVPQASRAVPILGGVAAGAFDYGTCQLVGKRAMDAFRMPQETGDAEILPA